MDDSRAPVVVGVGQETRRDQQWPDIGGPHDLIEVAARRADADAGGRVLANVDSLTVLNIFSWNYNNAPAYVADMLGLSEGERIYPEVGGNTPQSHVNRVAAKLAAGDIEVALICGAEAVAGKATAKKSGNRVVWGMTEDVFPIDQGREPVTPIEMMNRMMLPIVTFPLFEPALRVAAGRTPAQHSVFLGELMAGLSAVAAKNEYAWFQREWSPAEVADASTDNRMISTPYTKRMNAILNVDQGAALLLTTAGKARELGVTSDRWVYVLGGAGCSDIWTVSERASFSHSPAMRHSHIAALDAAGVGVDDIGHFDLYSCFPSAIQMGMDALGLAPDDPRGFSVTGGLPYAGGPGNNYVTHSIAAMVERLRDNPGETGMCTGLGWMITKHAAGVYASRPPETPFRLADTTAMQAEVDAADHPEIVEDIADATPEATIDAYSVSYSKAGEPEVALVLAGFEADGPKRTPVASRDADVLAELASETEWHGRRVRAYRGTVGHTFDLIG